MKDRTEADFHSNEHVPNDAFAELGRINLGDSDIDSVLQRIAEVAKAQISGTAEASVTLVQEGQLRSAASTSGRADELDRAQYSCGHGPCVDASLTGVTLLITDMEAEDRWPAFTAAALGAGVHSTLSLALPVQPLVTGAMNLYGSRPYAFDGVSQDRAQTLAGFAAVALANGRLYNASASLATQMKEAMATRASIEQAKGILMAQRGCDPDEAFGMLSRASQDSNRKLHDIAIAIVAGVGKSTTT